MALELNGTTGVSLVQDGVVTSAKIADGTIAAGDLDSSLSNSVTPSGLIAYFGSSTAPSGWIKANGAAISRTTYADLFAVVGTTYGSGDGSTTFNIPDLRGEFMRGWDDARGVDSGRTFGSFQTDAFEEHNHGLSSHYSQGNGSYVTSSSGYSRVNYTQSQGSASETRPRNIALLACIKY
jgi:microcystin-dependent protein